MLKPAFSWRALLATLSVLLVAELFTPTSVPAAAQEPPPSQERMQSFEHSLRQADAGQASAQLAGATCSTINYNQALDYDGYGWFDFSFATVLTSTEAYYSPYSSLRMYENAPGDPVHSTNFDDGFGQAFYVPDDTQRLEIEMRVAYSDDGSAGDEVIFELYEWTPGDEDGNNLGDSLLPTYYIPGQGDFGNDWFYSWATITDTNFIPSIRGKFVVLVYGTQVDELAPFQDVYLDDILVRSCNTLEEFEGAIGGTIVQSGDTLPDGLTDAQLQLVYFSADGESETVATTQPALDGSYLFENVPPLDTGAIYQVQFTNYGDEERDGDPSRLYSYNSATITQFSANQKLELPTFDVATVPLLAPSDDIQTVFPLNFEWQARKGGNQAGYKLCIYDLETFDEICSTSVLTETNFSLDAKDLVGVEFSDGFRFQYGRPYAWYVQVIGENFDEEWLGDLGYSYSANLISVFEAPPELVNQNPLLNLKGGGSGGAPTWTVMIYLAGDNDLGSPVFLGNMREQFANLERIAASYKGLINLVVLADFDQNGDTRYCVLTSDEPCAVPSEASEREKNTADPQVLTNFISTSVAAFDTSHYMLVIASHGHLVNGVVIDETTPGAPSLTPKQVRDAIGAGLQPSGKKLDLLFYNACLMGGLEAAFDASANAKYMVAASDQLWVVDVYRQLLDATVANADNPAAIASRLVEAYRDVVADEIPSVFTSIAAYDLSRADAVRQALSSLGNELSRVTPLVDEVRRQVQVYDSSGDDVQNTEDAFVDLEDLARRLLSVPDPGVQTAAANLLAALGVPTAGAQQAGQPLVIASQQISSACTVERNLNNASGLMIYFPSRRDYQPSELNDYRKVYESFNAENSWDDFVVAFVDKTVTRAPGKRRRGGLPVGGGVPGDPKACTWVPLLGR
jgi:hypothetical protein